MKTPKRMIDDHTQSEIVRRDLARTAAAPIDYDLSAGLVRMQASIGAALPRAKPPSSSPPALSVQPSAMGLPLKWVLLAAGGATILGLGITTSLRRNARAPTQAETAHSIELPVLISSSPLVATEPPPPIPQESASTRIAPRPPRPSPSASSEPTKNTLSEEIAQLETLRSLASENPAQAVTMADEGQRRFNHGIFEQEREAIAIRSLARTGRMDEAQTRARRFLDRFPKSPFAEKIRQDVLDE
jgi:hypothetical protein